MPLGLALVVRPNESSTEASRSLTAVRSWRRRHCPSTISKDPAISNLSKLVHRQDSARSGPRRSVVEFAVRASCALGFVRTPRDLHELSARHRLVRTTLAAIRDLFTHHCPVRPPFTGPNRRTLVRAALHR